MFYFKTRFELFSSFVCPVKWSFPFLIILFYFILLFLFLIILPYFCHLQSMFL